jgi:cytochrome c biogenesis protein CcmG/thiol:disulfide interchange protein DsbE
MMNRILVILGLVAATIVYSVYQTNTLNSQLAPEGVTTDAVLDKMPVASFTTLDGKPFPMESQTADLFIVHYWGTWCAPCEAELPELLTFLKQFGTRPEVKFYLVAVNDEEVKVAKHMAKLQVPKANIIWLIDNKNVYRDLFGTTRVPETWVFSSDKTTLRKYLGPQEWSKPVFFQTFDEFIQISTRKL